MSQNIYTQKNRINWIEHIQTYERYPLYNVTKDFQIDKNSRLSFEYLYDRIPDIWTRPKDKYYILMKTMNGFNVVNCRDEFWTPNPLEIELINYEKDTKQCSKTKDSEEDTNNFSHKKTFIIGSQGFYSEESHLFPSQLILQRLLEQEGPSKFSLDESVNIIDEFMSTTNDSSYLDALEMSPNEYKEYIENIENALGVLLCFKSPVLNKILYSQNKKTEYYLGYEESPLLVYYKYVRLSQLEEKESIDNLIKFYYRPRIVPIIKPCLQDFSKKTLKRMTENIKDPIAWRQMLVLALNEISKHKNLVMKEVQSKTPGECIIEFS